MNGARSLLFVPATSERKIERAFASAADGVILDLEDAVAVSEKPAARRALGVIISVPRRLPIYVRVNATSTPFCFQDLLAVTVAGVAGVVLPKAESADEMKTIDWLMTQLEAERGLAPGGCPLMPIVETARGLASVDAIAAATPRIGRLLFGAVDLAADMAIDLDDDAGAIAQARFAIARASRAAGLEAPFDTAFVDIKDAARLRASAERARALGFSGKACIHPDQIDIVNEVFTPSARELERAARIVAAFAQAEAGGRAALALDGQMIDYPIVEKARRLLDRWGKAGAVRPDVQRQPRNTPN
ncbi:MAG TPA: CoA ester lyase [Burkholderiales bacterium]|nr:CoA ester lyase [Burkholderiales bacterium]